MATALRFSCRPTRRRLRMKDASASSGRADGQPLFETEVCEEVLHRPALWPHAVRAARFARGRGDRVSLPLRTRRGLAAAGVINHRLQTIRQHRDDGDLSAVRARPGAFEIVLAAERADLRPPRLRDCDEHAGIKLAGLARLRSGTAGRPSSAGWS